MYFLIYPQKITITICQQSTLNHRSIVNDSCDGGQTLIQCNQCNPPPCVVVRSLAKKDHEIPNGFRCNCNFTCTNSLVHHFHRFNLKQSKSVLISPLGGYCQLVNHQSPSHTETQLFVFNTCSAVGKEEDRFNSCDSRTINKCSVQSPLIDYTPVPHLSSL